VNLRRLWAASAVLAFIAFLYICMLLLFLVDTEHTSVFGVGLDDTGDIIIAGCLLMVLLPSLAWSSSVIRDRTLSLVTSSHTVTTKSILWTVSFASWVLIAQVVSISKSDGWSNQSVAAVVASIVFSFHVTFFDAYLWSSATRTCDECMFDTSGDQSVVYIHVVINSKTCRESHLDSSV
jgi:hypothetical protein